MKILGDRGIVRMVHMLQDELQMVMRLSGTLLIASISAEHVTAMCLGDHIVPLPIDNLVHMTLRFDGKAHPCTNTDNALLIHLHTRCSPNLESLPLS